MKFLKFSLLLWVSFALLDPDPFGIQIRIRNPDCKPFESENVFHSMSNEVRRVISSHYYYVLTKTTMLKQQRKWTFVGHIQVYYLFRRKRNWNQVLRGS
jgi:hypothetical protein